MKKIGLIVVQVLSVIGINISALWILVEFILYLVKDDKFNWMSVWLLITFVVVMIVNVIIAAIDAKKYNDKLFESLSGRKTTKSKWQQRMEEMAIKRGNNN